MYSGHLKLNLVYPKNKNLTKGTVVVIKPNMIPAIFQETLASDKSRCKVYTLNKSLEVNIGNIISNCQSPRFGAP